MELSQQLRDRARLDIDAAAALDSQSQTVTAQAARIAELESLLAELRGDLKPENFTFLGRVTVPVGMSCGGLAHDPATGWWYTVGQAGNAPFNLYRFKMPATLGTAAQAEFVGPINNAADVLGMAGKALVSCKGLLWEGGDALLVNYGSYYANGANTNFLARYNVVTKTVTGGPWMVDASIGSERAKGVTMAAPPALAQATGKPLVSLGVIGSTAQQQSWGLGLVALDSPAVSPVPAAIVAHWPMKIWPGSNPVIPYSDYPGDDSHPLVYLQRAADGTVIKTPMTGGARFHSGCFLGDKHFMSFGSSGHGHTWYGNQADFMDVPSLIDPTKATMGMSVPRGGHVEATIDKWWLFRVEDIAAKFHSGDKLISHYSTGRMSELGGGVPVPLQTLTFGQAVEVDGRVHVICHGSGNNASPQILVFGVKG